ncbi:hypothetical protein [Martelella sp. HB161492]|uniref:hypothetical protein n=1 Tax=Martelella sp. HB161492 TaxID=2720726 RepID=UPI00158FDCAB|nr:hypothetical protein [Martelella sp. HB161492]
MSSSDEETSGIGLSFMRFFTVQMNKTVKKTMNALPKLPEQGCERGMDPASGCVAVPILSIILYRGAE